MTEDVAQVVEHLRPESFLSEFLLERGEMWFQFFNMREYRVKLPRGYIEQYFTKWF
jgi:hypothetical protein